MSLQLYKYKWFISLGILIITTVSFYVNYTIVVQPPLTSTEHFGFFLYGFVFSLVALLFMTFKSRIGSIVFIVGWVVSLVSLYIELLKSQSNSQGTLGAGLGFLTNMVLSIIFAVLLEVVAHLFFKLKKNEEDSH